MKKFTALLIAVVMTLALAACGGTSAPAASAAPAAPAAPAASGAPAASEAPADIDWPKKSIQFVVPYNAGGDTDFYARATAKYLEEELGVSIAVVNTAGASGTTGALSVLDQDADGYCFLFGHQSVLFNQAAGSVPFDYTADFTAVGSPLTDHTYGLYCRADAPYSTLAELAEYCKAHPGEVSIIGAKNASSGHMASMMEKGLGDISFRLVEGPSSSAEKLAGFLGGQYDLLTGNFAQYKDYVKEGTIVALGNYGSKDVEALTELGIKSWTTQGYDVKSDYTFMIRAKTGTDQAIIDKLSAALEKICEDPAYQEEVAAFNPTVGFQSGEACQELQKAYFNDCLKFLGK